jgi:hypothetical protein
MTITLHLSRKIQRKLEALATRQGQNIEVIANKLFEQAVDGVSQDSIKEPAAFAPNEKAIAALCQITQMQKGMRHTDGSQTERLIREGRDGAMYGDDVTE